VSACPVKCEAYFSGVANNSSNGDPYNLRNLRPKEVSFFCYQLLPYIFAMRFGAVGSRLNIQQIEVG
jgi:hypothetical protein